MTMRKVVPYKCPEIDYEHIFEYIDDNRIVSIETTGTLICKIKKWLDFLSKNKGEYFQKWNSVLSFHLIADGINPNIKEGQDFVELNYKLLALNKSLTYNQALFLLLGLNAHELGRNIKDFPILDGDEPIAQPIEMEFWRTPQNQALKSSSFVIDGKITSDNLWKLTSENDNNFFTKTKPQNQDSKAMRVKRQSTIDKEVLISKIYKELKNKYPDSAEEYLAQDISEILLKKHDIKLKPATILRDYL